MLNSQSKIKLIKQDEYQYIILYFKYKKKLLRIQTEQEYIPGRMTKDLLYTSKVEGFQESNDKLKRLKRRVDDYITYRLGHDLILMSNKECRTFLKSTHQSMSTYIYEQRKLKGKTFLSEPESVSDILDRFYQFKKSELNNRPSYKDYLTLVNSLKDFQKSKQVKLTFEKMNTEEFMVDYRNFLSEKRGEEYLSRGGLNDNTINKRFSGLKTFFLWCENRELYTFKRVVHNFSVPKYSNNIIVLTKDEISNLLSLTFENPTWEKIRDVFVCNCFMGLRISDLKTITKVDFYLDTDGDYILMKENKKTNIKVEIPIVGTCLDILKKYDFDLPKFSDQYFNDQLKKLLEDKKLFNEPVTKIRRVNRDIQDKSVPRRTLITSHTCRRTFVTLGISENIPINTLMLSSGHKQIQTLQKYMKKVLDKKSFKKIDLIKEEPNKTEENPQSGNQN